MFLLLVLDKCLELNRLFTLKMDCDDCDDS